MRQLVLVAVLLACGCGGDGPASNNGNGGAVSLNIGGVWTGTIAGQQTTWTVIQSGNSIQGTFRYPDRPSMDAGSVVGNVVLGTTTFNVTLTHSDAWLNLNSCSTVQQITPSYVLEGTAQNVTSTKISGTVTGKKICPAGTTNVAGTMVMGR